MAITVASFSDSTQPLYRAGLADLLATVVVFSFSLAFRNSSFYDAYWSGALARVLVVFVIAPTRTIRLTGNWAGVVVMVVLFLGVSILLIDAQLFTTSRNTPTAGGAFGVLFQAPEAYSRATTRLKEFQVSRAMKVTIALARWFRIGRSWLIKQQFRLDFEFASVFDFLVVIGHRHKGTFGKPATSIAAKEALCYICSTMLLN